MKKILFSAIILSVYLGSCIDRSLPLIDGMWQLQTIEDENNAIQTVDTIFYAFQRQAIFSYTIVYETEVRENQVYGYIDFPDNSHLHILLDKGFHECCKPALFENQTELTYEIVRLDAKQLILSRNRKMYHFVKF